MTSDKIAKISLLTGVLCCAVSVALSKIFLGLYTLTYAFNYIQEHSFKSFIFPKLGNKYLTFALISLYCLILSFLISTLLGVNLANSAKEVAKTSFWIIFFLALMHLLIRNPDFSRKIIIALITSVFITSLHTLYFGGEQINHLWRPPGPLTESGILTLVIPVIMLALYSALINKNKYSAILLIIFITCLVALFINIKRGPIIAVFIEFSIIGILYFLHSRERSVQDNLKILLIPFISILILTIGAVYFLPNFNDRFFSIWEHFTISGGRQELWEIGKEIISLYPLGVGADNSDIIREAYPLIPESHKHLHNTILNLTLEVGFFGVIAFIYMNLFLIIAMIKDKVFGSELSNYLFLGISLIGFQIAGVFEYNFGDGEIRNIYWIIVALIFSELENKKAQTSWANT